MTRAITYVTGASLVLATAGCTAPMPPPPPKRPAALLQQQLQRICRQYAAARTYADAGAIVDPMPVAPNETRRPVFATQFARPGSLLFELDGVAENEPVMQRTVIWGHAGKVATWDSGSPHLGGAATLGDAVETYAGATRHVSTLVPELLLGQSPICTGTHELSDDGESTTDGVDALAIGIALSGSDHLTLWTDERGWIHRWHEEERRRGQVVLDVTVAVHPFVTERVTSGGIDSDAKDALTAPGIE